MKGSALWVMVECACRVFGISTAAGLCAVGIETLRQGEFTSLAIYLLISSVLIMLWEITFYIDALLDTCTSCPPTWKFFIVCKKLAKVGGFQKFLYYTMMSIMCFLHPVLAWHAIIPGIMLLVTGFLNFILSKKKKSETPKEPSAYDDPTQSSVSLTDTGDTERTFSFLNIISGKRVLSRLQGQKDSTLFMLEKDPSVKKAYLKKTNMRNMKTVNFMESVREDDSEMMDPMETTSDTAPIIQL